MVLAGCGGSKEQSKEPVIDDKYYDNITQRVKFDTNNELNPNFIINFLMHIFNYQKIPQMIINQKKVKIIPQLYL